ncbi:MAG TPA: DUF4157 domain-containing protein [Chthoniobacterales bacterium]
MKFATLQKPGHAKPLPNAKRRIQRLSAQSPSVVFPIVQAKLRIGAPHDRFEQEADRVADEVIRTPEPDAGMLHSTPSRIPPHVVQRVCAACANGESESCAECDAEEAQEEEVVQYDEAARTAHSLLQRRADRLVSDVDPSDEAGMYVPAATHDELNRLMITRGTRLPPSIRASMEARFGCSFGTVSIQTSPAAARLSQQLGARAFTVGSHIFFGAGEFEPRTRRGQRLIAHELTHTLQQTGDPRLPARTMSASFRVQKAPLRGCTPQQTTEMNDAIVQANTDFNAAISLLQSEPQSQRVRDALWLTFRDTDALKATSVREILTTSRDSMPQMPIYCEQQADYGEECAKGAEGYHSRAVGLNIHLCMGTWPFRSVNARARTLIHEAVHHFDFIRDKGYFSETCEKTGETAALSMAQLYTNADSYACNAYLLSHESSATLRNRVDYYQREYRGETIQGIVQYPIGPVNVNSDYEHLPRFRVGFEGDEKFPHESKIPGAQFRWTIINAAGNVFPMGPPGQEGQFTDDFESWVPGETRQRLKSGPLGRAIIQCDIKIPGSNVGPFTVHHEIDLIALSAGWQETATCPFDKGSTEPDDLAMLELTRRVISSGILTGSGNFHVTFEGHASRVGSDEENMDLSVRRAQAVKDTLESWLASVSGDSGFQFNNDQFTIVGRGEEEARKAGKPENDDSPADRVVKIIIEIR